MTTKIGRPTTYLAASDYNYLYQEYIVNKKSTVEIASNIGCNAGVVSYRLKSFGIKLRNISESHIKHDVCINLDYDVIYGSLLGDACLLKRNKKTNLGGVLFSKSNIGYDHVLYVGSKIYNKKLAKDRIYEYRKSKNKPSFKFTTLTHPEFSQMYEEWYPNGKKIVPKTLQLTPSMLLHWFMDDGTSVIRKDRKTKQVNITLCSESFTMDDNIFLKQQLEEFGLICFIRRNNGKGTDCRIAISQNSYNDFLTLIGKCPVPSMEYKWK